MLTSTTTAARQLPVVRPALLRMWVAADRATLKHLADDSRVEVADTLESQLAELVQTRHPSRKLSPGESSEGAAEPGTAGRARRLLEPPSRRRKRSLRHRARPGA